jgi:uncharacterized phiE125 gp8 family phage protein
MALTTVTLKSNVFLTLEDAKDWCKVPATNSDHDGRIARLLNHVTDLCEKYIEGPIKTRSYVEYKDGDASNVIVPTHYPVRTVTEVKVDFNRGFGAETLVAPANYILRGPTDLAGEILGTDIVLRDDGNTAVLGRIFTGTAIGAVKIAYTAGYGADQNAIPSDLVQAVLMGVEYFYKLRDASDLGVKSRGNQNQSYSKDSGLPVEVTQILDQYKDYTLGGNNVPQKNIFSI